MVATVWSKQSILLVGDCITSKNKHFKEFFYDDHFDLLNLGGVSQGLLPSKTVIVNSIRIHIPKRSNTRMQCKSHQIKYICSLEPTTLKKEYGILITSLKITQRQLGPCRIQNRSPKCTWQFHHHSPKMEFLG